MINSGQDGKQLDSWQQLYSSEAHSLPSTSKLSTHADAASKAVPADPLGQPTTFGILSTK